MSDDLGLTLVNPSDGQSEASGGASAAPSPEDGAQATPEVSPEATQAATAAPGEKAEAAPEAEATATAEAAATVEATAEAEVTATAEAAVTVEATEPPQPIPAKPGFNPLLLGGAALILVAVIVAVLVGAKRRKKEGGAPADVVETEPIGAGEKPPAGRRPEPRRKDFARRVEVPESERESAPPEEPESGAAGYSFGYAQTMGKRENQEDSYCISRLDAEAMRTRGLLAAVADGIGGLDNGQVASGTVMRNMAQRFDQQDPSRPAADRLLELAAAGQEDVLRINRAGGQCGTTLVSVLVAQGGMVLLSVGDSRIALYRSGALMQLNREHVLGRDSDESEAMGHGSLAEGRKRGAITAYLGRENLRLIDRTLRPMQLVSGDRVLLMTDGVYNTLSDEEIMAKLNLPPMEAARAIIEAVDAKQVPHQDNATIVIVGMD